MIKLFNKITLLSVFIYCGFAYPLDTEFCFSSKPEDTSASKCFETGSNILREVNASTGPEDLRKAVKKAGENFARGCFSNSKQELSLLNCFAYSFLVLNEDLKNKIFTASCLNPYNAGDRTGLCRKLGDYDLEMAGTSKELRIRIEWARLALSAYYECKRLGVDECGEKIRQASDVKEKLCSSIFGPEPAVKHPEYKPLNDLKKIRSRNNYIGSLCRKELPVLGAGNESTPASGVTTAPVDIEALLEQKSGLNFENIVSAIEAEKKRVKICCNNWKEIITCEQNGTINPTYTAKLELSILAGETDCSDVEKQKNTLIPYEITHASNGQRPAVCDRTFPNYTFLGVLLTKNCMGRFYPGYWN